MIQFHEELQFLESVKELHRVGDIDTLRNIFKIHNWNTEVLDLDFLSFCKQINMVKSDVKLAQRAYWQARIDLK